jgi:hypothetical protein
MRATIPGENSLGMHAPPMETLSTHVQHVGGRWDGFMVQARTLYPVPEPVVNFADGGYPVERTDAEKCTALRAGYSPSGEREIGASFKEIRQAEASEEEQRQAEIAGRRRIEERIKERQAHYREKRAQAERTAPNYHEQGDNANKSALRYVTETQFGSTPGKEINPLRTPSDVRRVVSQQALELGKAVGGTLRTCTQSIHEEKLKREAEHWEAGGFVRENLGKAHGEPQHACPSWVPEYAYFVGTVLSDVDNSQPWDIYFDVGLQPSEMCIWCVPANPDKYTYSRPIPLSDAALYVGRGAAGLGIKLAKDWYKAALRENRVPVMLTYKLLAAGPGYTETLVKTYYPNGVRVRPWNPSDERIVSHNLEADATGMYTVVVLRERVGEAKPVPMHMC